MAGISPTQRTLKYLEKQGYVCGIVERWIKMPTHPAGGFRRDYLKCIDIIAISDGETLGVQSCGSAFSQHYRDLIGNPDALKWITGKCRRRLMLIGWRKLKVKRGGKNQKH
jgi:hypothetical protein